MSLNPIGNGIATALSAQPTRRDAAIAGEPMQAGRQFALGLNQLAPEQRVSALDVLGERFSNLGVADRQWLARGVADGFPPLTHGTGLTTQVLQPLDALGHAEAANSIRQESLFLFGSVDDRRMMGLHAASMVPLSVDGSSTINRETAPNVDPTTTPLVASRNDEAARQRDMLLDLVQLGLGIAGIGDVSGLADTADAVISFGRGDWLGGAISTISIIPIVGDLAKAGKLGKWAQTVVDAVSFASKNAEFAVQLRPVLRQIDRILDQIPIDRLPKPVREPLEKIRARIDDFFAGAGLEAGVGWRQRNETPEPWNTVTRADGSINDCNWCSLEIITGMPREQLAAATSRLGIDPGQRMSPAELGKALKNLGLIDDVKSMMSGDKASVLAKMMDAPVGTYFALSMSNAGRGGHAVVARRTSEGIQILDGQVNTAYDASKVAGMNDWAAYRLNGVRNPNL